MEHSNSTWLVQQGTPQGISNTLWACADLGYTNIAPLLTAMDEHLSTPRHWDQWNAQDLANAAWACAVLCGADRVDSAAAKTTKIATTTTKVLVPPRGLFHTMERNAVHLVRTGTAQEVSNALWACAKLSLPAPQLCRAVHQQQQAQQRSLVQAQSKPQHLANTAWALTVLGSTAPDYFVALQQHAAAWLNNPEEDGPRHVTPIVWCLATLGWDVPELFALLDEQAARQWSQPTTIVTSQDLSITLFSFATLGFPLPRLWEQLRTNEDCWKALLQYGSAQEICNTVWALAILAPSLPGLEPKWQQLWHRALQLFQHDPTQFIDASLFQLAQSQLLARADGVLDLEIPESLLTRMEENQTAQQQQQLEQSNVTPELSALLYEIGFGDHEWEVSPHISPHSNNNNNINNKLYWHPCSRLTWPAATAAWRLNLTVPSTTYGPWRWTTLTASSARPRKTVPPVPSDACCSGWVGRS
jgi:hypothetical protein